MASASAGMLMYHQTPRGLEVLLAHPGGPYFVNKDLGGSPMDADREMLALGAWSGEPDMTLRHEAEAAGTVRPGEEFFSGPGRRGR